MQFDFFRDPSDLYERVASLGDAVILDSGGDDQRGRWDIVAAAPDARFGLRLDAQCKPESLQSELTAWLGSAARRCRYNEDSVDEKSEAPFQGGFIGHFSYELGRRLQGFEPAQKIELPLAVVHYYPWAIVQDRQKRQCYLVGDFSGNPGLPAELARRLGSGWKGKRGTLALLEKFAGAWDLTTYSRVFAKVKGYILDGDCYQINLGQSFSAAYRGDLFLAYRQLRAIARAPFSAYLPLSPTQHLLCLSPERFLTVDKGRVETRPIKGTRPRYKCPDEDRGAARELLQSEKERAENLMIVDLLRNDLGRYCKPGSVHVDSLFNIETYATVHHLVSVVRAELTETVSPLELLVGCLPGGSITGAPKHRAMQIIDELEVAPRQAWCGSTFYYSHHGRLDSNINIRTLFSQSGRLHCWAGGGLVNDSQATAEFQEQKDKVGAFLQALEQEFAVSNIPADPDR